MALFVVPDEEIAEEIMVNKKWEDILGHLESTNPHSWVIAILECDKILEELLRERGYNGENIGSDFVL